MLVLLVWILFQIAGAVIAAVFSALVYCFTVPALALAVWIDRPAAFGLILLAEIVAVLAAVCVLRSRQNRRTEAERRQAAARMAAWMYQR